MACCANPGGCGRPTCRLCTVIAKLPQPTHASDLKKHDRADFRESKLLPDLTGPRAAAIALGQRKRTRKVFTRGNR